MRCVFQDIVLSWLFACDDILSLLPYLDHGIAESGALKSTLNTLHEIERRQTDLFLPTSPIPLVQLTYK